MSDTKTNVAAFVGAAGGAGTTRTVIEVGSALAAGGGDVAVLDAAFATQGLSAYVEGQLDPDLTALLTDAVDADLSDGLVEVGLGGETRIPGRIAVCPAYAPFEQLARAKRVESVRRFESLIATAAGRFDHVLLDVPPIAANQAVAAVNAADRVAVVAPASERGSEAVQQCHERLADVGTEASLVISTRGELATADVTVPAIETTSETTAAPTYLDDGGAFAAAIDRVATAVTGQRIEPVEDGEKGLLGSVGQFVSR
jgi:cellulose biosynthesis protein BcsQ